MLTNGLQVDPQFYILFTKAEFKN